MFFPIINANVNQATVLVVPLDWGLGHATRCISIIKELLINRVQVVIAAEGRVKLLLLKEFPGLTFIDLPGYNISYSKSKNGLAFKMFLQAPKILFRIYQEHQWLKKIVRQYSITAVISDNRFGLYHKSVPCIYITHQLQIKTGNSFFDTVTRKMHYWFIKKYNQCWVPDFESDKNVAGELSHPSLLPANAKYIGCISRFEKNNITEKKYDVLIIISGPEPQRSLFEKLLLEQLNEFNGTAMLVRGLPGNEDVIMAGNKNVVVKNHLEAEQLNIAIEQSDIVISRSGYTTVMDLIKLKKKAILVATPGQTEQEYLAGYLQQQQIFLSVQQQNFSLIKILDEAKNFLFSIPAFDMEQYKKQISEFVNS